MYKLPKNLKELQIFAEEEGRIQAGSLSSKEREGVDSTTIAKMFFWFHNTYKKDSEKKVNDPLKEGKEIFVKHFQKGFREFE